MFINLLVCLVVFGVIGIGYCSNNYILCCFSFGGYGCYFISMDNVDSMNLI